MLAPPFEDHEERAVMLEEHELRTTVTPLQPGQLDLDVEERLRSVVHARLFGSTVSFGRYRLVGPLGAGGMGVVFRAHDTELDRPVALKLLAFSGEDVEERRQRLLREAQAMARVNDPNVVRVYDVGTHRGQLYVAMELVEGRTLRDWLRERRRPWRAIVDVFVAAGRGLQAAHEAGLVHRDFKPENVLIDDKGRCHVADFGLVSPVDSLATTGTSGDDAASSANPQLTRTGALLGTPIYMSPEQHLRREVDARSDLFGFCVALFEGLYGHPPFVGTSLDALAEAKRRGDVHGPSRNFGVPRRVRRAIVRGLRPDPRDRWPDMQALLDALQRGSQRRWRTRQVVAVASGSALLVGLALRLATSAQPWCESAETRLRGTWDPERRDALVSALAASGEAVAERIDAHAEAWSEAWLRSCAVEGPRAPAVELCLEAERRSLHDVTEAFVAGKVDASAAEPMLATLNDGIDCSPAAAERWTAGMLEATSATHEGLRFRLVQAEALWHAGLDAKARVDALAIAEQARRDGADKLRVDATLLAASTMLSADRGVFSVDTTAEQLGVDAVRLAAELGDPRQLLRAEALQFALTGTPWAKRHDEMPALLARVRSEGDPESVAIVELAHARLSVWLWDRSREEALDRAWAAADALADGHRLRQLAIAALAEEPAYRAFVDDELRRQLARATAVWGPRSLPASLVHDALAEQLEKEHRWAEAVVHRREQIAGYEASAPTSDELGTTLLRLAVDEARLHRIEAARAAFERAVEILPPSLGEREDPAGKRLVVYADLPAPWHDLTDLVDVMLIVDRPADAIAPATTVLDLATRWRGRGGAQWGGRLAAALVGAGQPERGLAIADAALASYAVDEAVYYPSQTRQAELEVIRGRALLALDRRDEAIGVLERGLAGLLSTDADGRLVASVALAAAHADAGRADLGRERLLAVAPLFGDLEPGLPSLHLLLGYAAAWAQIAE